MLQNIIGVLFGSYNQLKIQLDKAIFYTGDEVNLHLLTGLNCYIFELFVF